MAIWDRGHRIETETHRPWQAVTLLLGLAAVVVGVWALVRTGFSTDHPFRPERVVLGLHHSPALAMGEIVAGVMLVLLGRNVILSRAVTGLIGMASATFGVLI